MSLDELRVLVHNRTDPFIAAFPLFGNQMYVRLGFQWASSLLGFLAIGMMVFPYLFFRYGKLIRGKSKFADASTSL